MNTQAIPAAQSLRNLYFTRSTVQLIWAVTVLTIAANNPALGIVLLALYPLWDVACTLYDIKTSAGSGSPLTQYANAAIGVLAAAGIALTGLSHPPYAVATFGGWALVAGLLQLVVGLVRRKRLGGQWAMILSGVQSTLAGAAFALGGLSGKFHVKDMAGYAIFGAAYFLIAGILLTRKLRT